MSQHKLIAKISGIEATYPRGRDHTSTITNSCNVPFKTVSISGFGECFLCHCDAWLPISVGKITDFSRLEDIWNNNTALQLQQDITDKKFTYCAVEHCGVVYNSKFSHDYRINVALDDSCNIACPSCRRNIINYTDGPVFEERSQQVNHFLKLLKNFDKPFTIILTGSGDPLASSIMRPIVLNWTPKVDQRIVLFTNGLLIKKLLPDSTILPNIREFQISVDAGTKQVYENVRRPGKFEVLQENLKWLSQNQKSGVKVSLKFTLSAANAADIVNFSDMCKQYGFTGHITKLDNWNTFDDFNSQDVVDNTKHELHLTAVEQLKIVSTHSHIGLSQILRKLL